MPTSDYKADLDKIWQKPSWSDLDKEFVFSAKAGADIGMDAFDSNGLMSKSAFNEALISDPEVAKQLDEVYEKAVGSNVDFDLARQMLENSYKSSFIESHKKHI